LLAVPLTALVLADTRFGLRLRAVGESRQAVAAAGLLFAAANAAQARLQGAPLLGNSVMPV
jgi:ABC-type uncharacterized transport system permease subunit